MKTLLIAPLIVLLGCAGERAAEEGGMAEGEMAEETTADTMMADTATMAMAAATYNLAINNPMPHEMIVYYEKPGGPAVELGSVAAKGTATFEITTPEDKQIELRATDAGETHSVTGSVVLVERDTVQWRIE